MQHSDNHGVLREHFGILAKPDQLVIALAGNPNVGKSTVFNALTGLRQHTGNWPGKTVDNAQGYFSYHDKSFLLIDLPGTYSLLAHTTEEEIARDFICFGHPDVTLVVLDATSLERNLNLALQVMEISANVVVCVNLIDEAKKKRIFIDFTSLEKELGVPVVAAAARQGFGIQDLKENLYQVAIKIKKSNPIQLKYSEEVENAVDALLPHIEHFGIDKYVNPRWLALRLLDGDEKFINNIISYIFSQSHLFLQSNSSFLGEVEAAL